MTKIRLKCVSNDENVGYWAITFEIESSTTDATAGGTTTILVNDSSKFIIGQYYNLDLESTS